MIDLYEAAEIAGFQDKKAVVVIGRFQPPHIGHGVILSRAKNIFMTYKFDNIICVVVAGKTTSLDKTVNPLTPEARINYLENSTFGKGITYISATNAFNSLVRVRELGYEPIVIVGGKSDEEDKTENYVGMLDKYFKTSTGADIDHFNISVTRSDDSSYTSNVSGSIVRAAVAANMYDDFSDWTGLDSDEITRKMFNELRRNMGFNKEV